MEIIHKAVADLNAVEYRACHKANFGPKEGYMQEELEACLSRAEGRVVMLWDGPPDKIMSLRGWALLSPCKPGGPVGVSRWVTTRSKYTVHFWVKPRWRERGYGSLLMHEVKKLDDNPHVIPHDNISSEFFSSYKVQVLKIDKWRMRRKPRVA